MNDDAPDRVKTCWYSAPACPACGGPLATNGRHEWCAAPGLDGRAVCGYGIAELAECRERQGEGER